MNFQRHTKRLTKENIEEIYKQLSKKVNTDHFDIAVVLPIVNYQEFTDNQIIKNKTTFYASELPGYPALSGADSLFFLILSIHLTNHFYAIFKSFWRQIFYLFSHYFWCKVSNQNVQRKFLLVKIIMTCGFLQLGLRKKVASLLVLQVILLKF